MPEFGLCPTYASNTLYEGWDFGIKERPSARGSCYCKVWKMSMYETLSQCWKRQFICFKPVFWAHDTYIIIEQPYHYTKVHPRFSYINKNSQRTLNNEFFSSICPRFVSWSPKFNPSLLFTMHPLWWSTILSHEISQDYRK